MCLIQQNQFGDRWWKIRIYIFLISLSIVAQSSSMEFCKMRLGSDCFLSPYWTTLELGYIHIPRDLSRHGINYSKLFSLNTSCKNFVKRKFHLLSFSLNMFMYTEKGSFWIPKNRNLLTNYTIKETNLLTNIPNFLLYTTSYNIYITHKYIASILK